MPEEFILLGTDEQGEIISALAAQLGRPPAILEKDAWVCWTLDVLFSPTQVGVLPHQLR